MAGRLLILVGLVLHPFVALPVDKLARSIVSDSFPPDILVLCEGDVGVDCVLLCSDHCIRVGVHRCSRNDSEESGFHAHCVESAVLAVSEPCDIIAECMHLPSWDGRNEHREVGLSTS